MEAQLDTASPYTIMRQSIYKSIRGLGKWSNQRMSIKGFATESCYTLGYKEVNVCVNNEFYDLQCHVVDDVLLPIYMILGRDFINQTYTVIIGGVPTIKRLSPEMVQYRSEEEQYNHSQTIIRNAEKRRQVHFRRAPRRSFSNFEAEIMFRSSLEDIQP